MIIDYNQRYDSINISHVTDSGQIAVSDILLEDGYFKYVECEEHDPDKLTNLKSFHGSNIKIEKAKYFNHHNINEFLSQVLPTKYPEIYEKTSKLNIPNPYSVDIEIDIDPKFGYSNQHKVENFIRSISFTDEKLDSILFIVKNPEHPSFNLIDMEYINNIINESLTSKFNTEYDYGKQIRVFDTEIEMLNVFLECFNKYFHLIIGWNFFDYDWQYIYNRCEKLGINTKKASPIGKLSNQSVEISNSVTLKLKIPTHRIISDYMLLFKESLIYSNLESYSLNNICEEILGIQKVEFEGNLKHLYETDYLRFVAYSFVDTILALMI